MTKRKKIYTLDLNFPRLGGRSTKQLRQKQKVSSDAEFHLLKQALRALYEKEMDAVVMAFYENKISAREVIQTHQTGIVNQDFLFADADAFTELMNWTTSDHYCAENRRIHRCMMKQLRPKLRDKRIRDLPHILQSLRAQSTRRKSSFNKLRKACLSYIKHHSSERANSPLYQQVRQITPFKAREHKTRTNRPFKVNELDSLLVQHQIAEPVSNWIYWLCLHGLRPKELFEDGFEVIQEDGISVLHIKGKKTISSDRHIPLFMDVPSEPISLVRLRNALKKMNRSPYDCRRTFATWLQRAGVDRNAMKRWLGHSTISDTTDIYTQQQDITWIRDQAPLFSEWLRNQKALRNLQQDAQVFRPFASPGEIGTNRQFASLDDIKERLNELLWNWCFGDDQWCRQLYQVTELDFVEVTSSSD